MKEKKITKITLRTLTLVAATSAAFLVGVNNPSWKLKIKSLITSINRTNSSERDKWNEQCRIIDIVSSIDENVQKAYFYKASGENPRPLVVSLHTWSGDYTQYDELSEMSIERDVNYIHPNFRGANNSDEACCSKMVLSDIDDAIDYAKNNAHVDDSKIYVIGASGGGYSGLCSFMKSRHAIAKFSIWVPITDLIKWYQEGIFKGNSYAENILNCTSSKGKNLNISEAQKRSPIYWQTPLHKLNDSQLSLYTGIKDGLEGSVSITQSINFYNKILSDAKVADSSKYVSNQEKLKLLEFRKPLGKYGTLSGRSVCLVKKYQNLKLVIFDGNHEILTEHAFEELFR